MDLTPSPANFGSSQFKGKEGLEFDLKRGSVLPSNSLMYPHPVTY